MKNRELLSLQDSAPSSTYHDHVHTTVVLINEKLYSGFQTVLYSTLTHLRIHLFFSFLPCYIHLQPIKRCYRHGREQDASAFHWKCRSCMGLKTLPEQRSSSAYKINQTHLYIKRKKCISLIKSKDSIKKICQTQTHNFEEFITNKIEGLYEEKPHSLIFLSA